MTRVGKRHTSMLCTKIVINFLSRNDSDAKPLRRPRLSAAGRVARRDAQPTRLQLQNTH